MSIYKRRKEDRELEHLLDGEPAPIKFKPKVKVSPNDHLVRTYGITLEEKQQMAIAQSCMCAICCKQLNPDEPSSFAVDHCHATGNIRGILCRECNLLLGLAKDNQQILLNAVQYLQTTS